MKKLLLFFILNMLFILPVSSITLTGSAEYNIDSAKTEAFHGVRYSLDRNSLSNYLKDPNYIQNYTYVLRGKTKIQDRTLAAFSDGTYGVRYSNDLYHNYYYDTKGSLFKVDVLNKPFNEYPHRSVAYNKYGAFKNATFVVSDREQYLYDKNKNMIGHWVENACYDENGNVLMLRKRAQ